MSIKMTFLARKYDELLLLDAIQNFSSAMLPFFNQENYPFLADFYSSIMGSESPTSVNKDNQFTYQNPGRSTPPPTTSFLASKQDIQPIGDVAQEPNKEEKEKEEEKKEKDDKKDEGDVSSPDSNPGYKPDGKSGGEKKDSGKDGGGDRGDPSKSNGVDKLDGQWVRPLDAKPDKDEEEDDDECTVNCLYYTLQCCECTIT